MRKQEYDERCAALGKELIALNYKLDELPVGSAEYDEVNASVSELHRALARLDDEYNEQK